MGHGVRPWATWHCLFASYLSYPNLTRKLLAPTVTSSKSNNLILNILSPTIHRFQTQTLLLTYWSLKIWTYFHTPNTSSVPLNPKLRLQLFHFFHLYLCRMLHFISSLCMSRYPALLELLSCTSYMCVHYAILASHELLNYW